MEKIHQSTHGRVTNSAKKEISFVKVVGVGGARCKLVDQTLQSRIQAKNLIVADTNASLLNHSRAHWELHFDASELDSNAENEFGRIAANANLGGIRESLTGAKIVFIVAGMGGATGCTAARAVAKVASEMSALTVGVVFKPSPQEGSQCMKSVDGDFSELLKHVDCLLVIPCDVPTQASGSQSCIENCFYVTDEVSKRTIADIVEMLTKPCLVNISFEDMRRILEKKGLCRVGFGSASGADRASIAAKQAVASILREGTGGSCPKGVIVNITAARTGFKMKEISDAISTVRYFAAEDASIIFGVVLDESMVDAMRVTLVASGI